MEKKYTILYGSKYTDANIFQLLLSDSQYEQQLGNRIDNKIYIALTICGALLAFIASTINSNTIYSNCEDKMNTLFSTIILILIFAMLVVSIYIIINLISAIKAHSYSFINEKEFKELSCTKIKENIFNNLIDIITKNNQVNDSRLKKINKCYDLIIIQSIISILIFVIQKLILT